MRGLGGLGIEESGEVGLMFKITVGLDVGDRFSQVCAIDAEGVVLQESRVATTREALRERLPGQPSCRVIS